MVEIEIVSRSDRESVLAATFLKGTLRKAGLEIEDIPSKDKQSITALLALLLSSAVAVELARGLMSLCIRHREVKVAFRSGDTEIVIENITQQTLDGLLEKLKPLCED